MEEFLEDLKQKVAKHGHQVIAIAGGKESDGPPFHYTVGPVKYIGFEILAESFPPDLGYTLLNDLAKVAKQQGSLPAGIYTGLVQDQYPVALIEADPAITDEKIPLSYACFPERDDIPVLQLLLSDAERHLPWESGYSMAGQRLLLTDPDSPEATKTLSELPIYDIEAIVRGPAPDQPIH